MKESHESELPEAWEREAVAELKAGWETLDRLVPVFPPSQHWLENQVMEHQKKLRKKLYRDLTLFLTLALVIIFLTLSALAQLPVLYVGLQVAVLLVASAVIMFKERKRVSRR